VRRRLVALFAISKQIATRAHSSVSGLFTSYSCWQWRFEQIFESVSKAQTFRFKGLSQGGGGDFLNKFYINLLLFSLRASLFNKDLSNEPNFSGIHLAGQYL
jgi:hypothetical protein